MSFGVCTSDGAFEWGSYSILGFIGKLSNLLSPWFWRLMFDVVRFGLFAQDILNEEEQKPCCTSITDYEECDDGEKDVRGCDGPTAPDLFESIVAYLRRNRYSDQLITYFLIPMVAAPWCIDPEEFASTFPAKQLIRFM